MALIARQRIANGAGPTVKNAEVQD